MLLNNLMNSVNKKKNGSFRVKVPIVNNFIHQDNTYSLLTCEYEPVGYVYHEVNMLTQNEYADNWQLVVPPKRNYIKHYEENGVKKRILKSNLFKINLNLAQLPNHLWHRINYKNNVSDGMYLYHIESTPVDNYIRELVNILNRSYDIKYTNRVKQLLNELRENDIFGWIVIKAKSLYGL